MMIPFKNPYGAGGAIVPSSFAPDVAEGETPMAPATSPWVRPMNNAAPGALRQTGQTLAAAGALETRIGNKVGDQVQSTMDDAQTKAAENQFLQTALPALSQYRTTEGISAVQQFDPTSQALAKAAQDARASMTDPIQLHMLNQVLNDHMLSFGQQMADHENVQRVQYGKDQSEARAQSLNTMAALDVDGRNRPDSNFTKYASQSDAEVLHYAQLSGIAPDSPQADQMLRQNRTQRYRSVITSLLDQHAYNEALDFYGEHKGEMDLRAGEVLGNAVKTAAQSEQVTEAVNLAVQSLGKVKGAGPLSQPIPAGTISTTDGVDGIDIHTKPGTSVHAPANGTVTKVWNDPELGLSAQISLPNGYAATFSHLSGVNYREGQKITQGQVLGLSGQDENKNGVMHYAMTDPSGAYVDPRQASSSPFDPANFSSPDDQEKALAWINSHMSDPVMRREAEDQLDKLAQKNRMDIDQEHTTALKQATDYWFDHGQSLNGLPAAVKMQLTPGDMFGFERKGLEAYDVGQKLKSIDEVGQLADWNANPQTMTVDAVRQAYAQGRLSDASYQTALRRASEIALDPSKVDPNKSLAVSVDNQQIEDTLLQNGHADVANAKPGSAQQAQKVQLWNEIKDQVDAEQQVSKRPLTREQKQQVIDSTVLSGNFLKVPGWFGGSSYSPWTLPANEAAKATYTTSTGKTVNYEPIPASARAAAVRSLIARRLPITERNIYDTWVNAGMVK